MSIRLNLRLRPKVASDARRVMFIARRLGVRVSWSDMMHYGIVEIESRMRAECVRRGIDWTRVQVESLRSAGKPSVCVTKDKNEYRVGGGFVDDGTGL